MDSQMEMKAKCFELALLYAGPQFESFAKAQNAGAKPTHDKYLQEIKSIADKIEKLLKESTLPDKAGPIDITGV